MRTIRIVLVVVAVHHINLRCKIHILFDKGIL
jgi:hypothetical protein